MNIPSWRLFWVWGSVWKIYRYCAKISRVFWRAW